MISPFIFHLTKTIVFAIKTIIIIFLIYYNMIFLLYIARTNLEKPDATIYLFEFVYHSAIFDTLPIITDRAYQEDAPPQKAWIHSKPFSFIHHAFPNLNKRLFKTFDRNKLKDDHRMFCIKKHLFLR